MAIAPITRRSLLARFGLAAGCLALGIVPTPAGAAPAPAPTSFDPNVFIHIAADGKVSLVCHRSEMGQGIRTSLAYLFADELGAAIESVEIVQADGDEAYGDQNTDGSSSIRVRYDELRRIAAVARVMLCRAAARKLRVPVEQLTTRDGVVLHPPTGRSLPFGALVDAAAKLAVPRLDEVTPRPPDELRYVGQSSLRLLDGPAYVTGKALFAADVKLDGLLVAVIARPPVVGADVARLDERKAKQVPGVRAIVRMPTPKPPYEYQTWGGVAVVAEHTWAALRGREALEIAWGPSPHDAYDSLGYKDELRRSANRPGEVRRRTGDVDRALASATTVITRDYYVPHLPHLPMEPPAATARWHDGKVEIWACTQHPQAVQKAIARQFDVSRENVIVHVTFLGGAFGRKSKPDFIVEAVHLAKTIGAPVRVQWTRGDDIRHDYYNAASYQQLTAGLDEAGKVVAWKHRTVFPPIASVFDTDVDTPSMGDLQQGVLDYALDVPHVQAEAGAAKAHVRVGWLRSVYNIFHAFAASSMIDEIAAEKQADPVATLLEVIGPARTLSLDELGIASLRNYGASLQDHPVDAGRLGAVVRRVAERSDWANARVNGRALGIAAHRSFLAYTAVVVALEARTDRVAVDEVWITIDAGLIVNPDRARAQMEGAVVFGLNLALFGGVTFAGGRVQQANFHDLRLLRVHEAPRKIHVDLVPSNAPPAGIGEPGVPPVAPALANAYYALRGERLRELPLGKAFGI